MFMFVKERRRKMKLKKCEIVWLILSVIFYVCFNLPGVPPYGDKVGTMIHAACTVVPLWVISYIGMAAVFRNYPLNSDAENE